MNESVGYTRILIRDLRVMMHIGVYENEHGRSQPVVVNVVADTAPQADGAYVCYDTLAQGIRAIAGRGHIALVEDFAEGIAALALGTPGITGVTVRVEKTDALADAAAVGVEIRRDKAQAIVASGWVG